VLVQRERLKPGATGPTCCHAFSAPRFSPHRHRQVHGSRNQPKSVSSAVNDLFEDEDENDWGCGSAALCNLRNRSLFGLERLALSQERRVDFVLDCINLIHPQLRIND
jgi:hypothetical protein